MSLEENAMCKLCQDYEETLLPAPCESCLWKDSVHWKGHYEAGNETFNPGENPGIC